MLVNEGQSVILVDDRHGLRGREPTQLVRFELQSNERRILVESEHPFHFYPLHGSPLLVVMLDFNWRPVGASGSHEVWLLDPVSGRQQAITPAQHDAIISSAVQCGDQSFYTSLHPDGTSLHTLSATPSAPHEIEQTIQLIGCP